MAKLVISGREPGIEKVSEKKAGQGAAKIDEKDSLISKSKKIKSTPLEPKKWDQANKPLLVERKKNDPKSNIINEAPEPQIETEAVGITEKRISIEQFTITKDGGGLLVQFDIRNSSNSLGDVSGRIFVILKPDNNFEDQWLVVPAAPLKNGVPSEYKKGQYFSIAHFKPVRFKITNKDDPGFFKKASIFIFNEQADLIFQQSIDITET